VFPWPVAQRDDDAGCARVQIRQQRWTTIETRRHDWPTIKRDVLKERSVAIGRLGKLALALIIILLFVMDVVLAYLYVNASLAPPL